MAGITTRSAARTASALTRLVPAKPSMMTQLYSDANRLVSLEQPAGIARTRHLRVKVPLTPALHPVLGSALLIGVQEHHCMSLREGPGQVGNQSDFAHSAFLVEDRNYQHGDTFVQQDRSTAIYLYSGTDLHQYSTMRTPQNPSDDLIRLKCRRPREAERSRHDRICSTSPQRNRSAMPSEMNDDRLLPEGICRRTWA